ncbi:hypothetical protein SVIOM342S_03998 [Streptomyces violaceorubidus]
MTGRVLEPSAAVYSRSKRSGRLKSSWMVDICQVRPMASFSGLHGDLRAVERGAARVRHQFQVLLLGDLAQRLGGLFPGLVGAEADTFPGSLVDSSR